MYFYKEEGSYICKISLGSAKLTIISNSYISIQEALKEFIYFLPDTYWKKD